jgi:hypothetical protein
VNWRPADFSEPLYLHMHCGWFAAGGFVLLCACLPFLEATAKKLHFLANLSRALEAAGVVTLVLQNDLDTSTNYAEVSATFLFGKLVQSLAENAVQTPVLHEQRRKDSGQHADLLVRSSGSLQLFRSDRTALKALRFSFPQQVLENASKVYKRSDPNPVRRKPHGRTEL